jgi:hypothetical protein
MPHFNRRVNAGSIRGPRGLNARPTSTCLIRRAARESSHFTPKRIRAVRVQIVNGPAAAELQDWELHELARRVPQFSFRTAETH